MTYIDCYLVPIPVRNRPAYEELARVSAQVLREYGATRVFECWLDDSGPDASSYLVCSLKADCQRSTESALSLLVSGPYSTH